mmetsp:Transcript_40238/g.93567  ORF Transcript_40238/g.93567 Transcript_40238/m.93567 type:complete len:198 (+) Transcript_40238:83-676(+)|eukprot:CAMPEP_0171098008 /NCGR_PEP_ID=MMETSP0766_2-20121228/47879_1 /TAXON_ID=439317 /ORGANISM="Gambierdiscus australes, Strain CAWD 149" /LENGTH=197 /DNA_ID=CAMNT_0011557295 /DNA_START=77 /DNA_END=670 /DNA_ORIENTATION=-
MFLPLPSPPIQIGPPSEYARKRQPWLFALLVLQATVCAFRIFCLLDIMGGFIMLIMVAIGCYAWKEDMHITFICSWGLLCLVNGVFDSVRFIDLAVKSTSPMFSGHLSFWYNLGSTVQILIPACTLAGAVLAWFLYQDYAAQALPGSDGDFLPFNTYGTLGRNDALDAMGAPAGRGFAGGKATAQPFAGQGHRLGSN